MDRLLSAARFVYAAGIAAFGLLCLVYQDYVSALQPIGDALPARPLWVNASGVLLLVAGIGLMIDAAARRAALLTAALFFGGCLALHLPALATAPRAAAGWVGMFECLAIAGGALIVAAAHGAHPARSRRWLAVGRACFGISLPVFAGLHVVYVDYVASVIPAWIPGPVFWAYFTGAAHLSAGLAVLSGVMARLAATLAGAMYGAWAVILHVPRAIDSLGDRAEVTSLWVAVALCGAAWLVAGSTQRMSTATAAAARA